mmetsp:Transcript_1180/g.1343  ORF Transcript_1180/g.1343 Transcript_1180/m.1343 type:complete len:149 (+) Transcript_1180:330-776(+)|eukprot:CAMPEP_0170510454 /NCGR_PEP_ID=MMETSP0208-20121228/65773_1 /TAXON_ID=197538 /ORGANISM="Strombidium inclinatum, Strain S3" /LENGTH=148 /DNA_ID=CAMNT_0010793919 /DNA_START=3703 /DNA_END=4149 /DNA_ORIENTATION=+
MKKFYKYSQDRTATRKDEKPYSLKDFFALDYEKLIDSVFYFEDEEKKKEQEGTHTFVRVCRDTFFRQNVKYESLEIQDVSREFKIEQGEKKLLSLINATVSHEMRTPINAINSQNIESKFLLERMLELMGSGENNLDSFKAKLSRLHR